MMFSKIVHIFIGCLLTAVVKSNRSNNHELSVYGEVPGLIPSPFYDIKVRKVGSENWLNPFTLVTECATDK